MSEYPDADLSNKIILAAIEVHRHLGPGLLESAYAACLIREMEIAGLPFEREKALPVFYKGLDLDCGYRTDLIVGNRIVVELKCVEKILPIHEAQLLTYMRLAEKRTGLLLNFNSPLLKDGIKRMVL